RGRRRIRTQRGVDGVHGAHRQAVIVCKFGGTSVGDADAIRRAAEIVRSRLPQGPIAVVSALGGATNVLIDIAEQAARGQLIAAMSHVENVRDRHLRVAGELLPGPGGEDVALELSSMCDEIGTLAEALSVLGHLTPRSLDTVSSFGERMSSLMIAAAFNTMGVPAQLVDARRVMITDAQHTRAEPQTEAIADAARVQLAPLVRDKRVPVMGGYVGATSA